jgi:hypothetical protein
MHSGGRTRRRESIRYTTCASPGGTSTSDPGCHRRPTRSNPRRYSIQALGQQLNQRLTAVEQRLTAVEQRLTAVEEGLQGVHASLQEERARRERM